VKLRFSFPILKAEDHLFPAVRRPHVSTTSGCRRFHPQPEDVLRLMIFSYRNYLQFFMLLELTLRCYMFRLFVHQETI